MTWEEELKELFNDPLFNDVKPQATRLTSSDRLIVSFEEINVFYDEYNRLPSSSGNMKEKGLARRFENIIVDIDKQQRCLKYDRHNLIKAKEIDINDELNAIFSDPIFNMSSEIKALFNVPEHLKKEVGKADPDFVAQRTKCTDFDSYKQLFADTHRDIKQGGRRVIKFQESQLIEGTIFLVGGVLVLLNKIFEKKVDKNRKTDARTHCIFENGTESNLLLRSLGKAIYLDGYTVTESVSSDESFLQNKFNVEDGDTATGYIYVLKSKSNNPSITQYKNLYKIGFTTTTVEERVANASQQSTYLLDDIEIVATWKTYNLNASYFENMLHKLFGQVQLQVKIHHPSGVVIVPHEWFIVPLPIIRSAIDCIIKGIAVSYNAEEQMLEEHKLSALIPSVDSSKLKILSINVTESLHREVVNGSRCTVERRIKSSTVNLLTYQDSAGGKRWLVEYDAIKLTANKGADRRVAIVEITKIELDRDNNSVIYTLGRLYAC